MSYNILLYIVILIVIAATTLSLNTCVYAYRDESKAIWKFIKCP